MDEKHAKSHMVMASNKFIAYTHVLDRFLFEKDMKTLSDNGFASIKYMYSKQKRIGFRYILMSTVNKYKRQVDTSFHNNFVNVSCCKINTTLSFSEHNSNLTKT